MYYVILGLMLSAMVTEFLVNIAKSKFPSKQWKDQAMWRFTMWITGIPIAMMMLFLLELGPLFTNYGLPVAMAISASGKLWHDLIIKLFK